MSRRIVYVLPLLAVAVAVGAEKPAKVDESAKFFADKKAVPKFVISPDDAAMKSLRQDPRKKVPVTVTVDGVEFEEVSIHLKGGAGSFRNVDDKPALTLNFDKNVDKQRFHGLDKIHLNNSVQDPAWMTEIVCGDLFLAAGVPTARATHGVVELAGRLKGLYVLKEGYNRTFLKRYFKDPNGNLYDGGFLTDINQPLVQNAGKETTPVHADLKALADACQEGDIAKRKEKVEKLLDLDRFITFAALEVMTWHWDGYTMKSNNYRVYHDPSTNKIIFFAHGMDQMFWEPNGPITAPGGGLVARSVFEVPEWRKRYYERVAELRKTVFLPEAMDRRIDDLTAKLVPVLETFDKNTARDLPNRAKDLKNRIHQRAESIDKQLAERAKRGK